MLVIRIIVVQFVQLCEKKWEYIYNMQCYALFLKEEDEIDYYPKLENHTMSFEEIEAYLTKNGVEKWSLYDHVPNEEDIEVFSGVCFDSSDGECDE